MKCFNILLYSVIGLMLMPVVSADFSLVRPETLIAEDAVISETYWRSQVEPKGEFDEIGLHRYQVNSPANSAIVLLYLPGTNMNGELSVVDENHSLWLFLAARGIKVYTLDYRTHAIPNVPIRDFEFMRQWGVEQFVNDAAIAVDFIRKSEPGLPIFVAGFSRGVTYAYALSGQRDIAGLVALDGGFKNYERKQFDITSALNRLDQSGQYASILSRSRGWENRQLLMQRTWQNPDGPALTDRYETVGEQLTATLYNAWGKGRLTNPVDGVSSIEVLARMMENYDRFFPAIQNIQGRSLASQIDDPSTELDDHFGEMEIPILYFGATNLGGDNLMNGIYSAVKSGSKDVTIHVLENHGHLDVLIGDRAGELVYDVVLNWMLARVPKKPGE